MLVLEDVTQFLASETGLATISTTQMDGRVLSSIANCGVIQNPLTGADCVALVSTGRAARLDHVRRGDLAGADAGLAHGRDVGGRPGPARGVALRADEP